MWSSTMPAAARRSTSAKYLVRGFRGRRGIEQLRADVAVDALHGDMRQRRGAAIQGEGFVEGDAELGRS
jgi:hypothetical protein